jgi:hypothetical protein
MASFAIALALLIIDIKIPASEGIGTTRELWLALGQLRPSIVAVVLSFAIIYVVVLGCNDAEGPDHREQRRCTPLAGTTLISTVLPQADVRSAYLTRARVAESMAPSQTSTDVGGGTLSSVVVLPTPGYRLRPRGPVVGNR